MAERGATARRRIVLGTSLGLVAAVVGALMVPRGSPAASGTNVVAWYQMNEPAGATELVDSGTVGLPGTIGSEVVTGQEFELDLFDADPNDPPIYGFTFPDTDDPYNTYQPERLVRVPSSDELNPDDDPTALSFHEFAVEVRFRHNYVGNIVQKGQNGAWGGYWKIEVYGWVPSCVFQDSNGNTAGARPPFAGDGEEQVGELLYGVWHTVRCERTASAITLYLDGEAVASTPNTIGLTANRAPLAIGGKHNCEAETVECDYFIGDIDYVKIEKDIPVPPSTTTTTTGATTTTTDVPSSTTTSTTTSTTSSTSTTSPAPTTTSTTTPTSSTPTTSAPGTTTASTTPPAPTGILDGAAGGAGAERGTRFVVP